MSKLHDAVSKGDAKEVKKLLTAGTVDVAELDEKGCSPLCLASVLGQRECRDVLLAWNVGSPKEKKGKK